MPRIPAARLDALQSASAHGELVNMNGDEKGGRLMFERILIPLDGSRLAERILVQVGKILRRKDSEVILVRAVPGLPEIPTVQYAAMIRQEEEVAGK